MTAPSSASDARPRWILWMLLAGALVALVAAYAYGPGDRDESLSQGSGPSEPPSTAPATDSTTLTSEPPTSAPPGSTGGPDGTPPPSSEDPTTTSAVPTTPPPVTTQPTPPPTVLVTTAPPPPPPPPPSPGRVRVLSCRHLNGQMVSRGTIENQGGAPQTYRVHAYVQDRGGATIFDLTTEVPTVDPGKTITFEINQPSNAEVLANAGGCKGDGWAEAL